MTSPTPKHPVEGYFVKNTENKQRSVPRSSQGPKLGTILNSSALTHKTSEDLSTDSDRSEQDWDAVSVSLVNDIQDEPLTSSRPELDFVGRSKFLQAVQDLIVQPAQPAATTVVVNGAEATGKTRFLQELAGRGRLCIWISFTEHDNLSHTYSAFWRGLNPFLREFIKDRQLSLNRGSIRLLQPFIPCLRDDTYMAKEKRSVSMKMTSLCLVDAALMQLFRWIFQQMVPDQQHRKDSGKSTVVLSCSLLLLLDDLQYSSVAARNLVQRFQQTFQDKPLAVVATCCAVHSSSDMLAKWLINQKQAGTHMKRLPNWSYNNVAHLVRNDPVWKGDFGADNVAQVVFTRTSGHAGSVLALLRVAKGLSYTTALHISSIPVPSAAADKKSSKEQRSSQCNGVAVLHHLLKMQFWALPESLRILLQVAAVYMPLFGADSIAYLVRQPTEAVYRQLCYACDRGLLKHARSTMFAFESAVRNVVLQALSKSGKHADLQMLIGRRLQKFSFAPLQSLSPGHDQEASRIFLRAINHLNTGLELRRASNGRGEDVFSTDDECLAELNTRAAAICLATDDGITVARQFLEMAISCLGQSAWQRNFSWRIDLESKLAQVEYACGNLTGSDRCCVAVIKRAKSFADKRAVVHTRISILARQPKLKNAKEFVIRELIDLGERIPLCFAAVQQKKQIRDLQTRLLKFDWDAWRVKPVRSNVALDDRMELLERLVECTMLNGSTHHSVALLRCFELIIDNGPRFHLGPLCFVYWGSKLREMGFSEEALRFGSYGLELVRAKRRTLFDLRAEAVFCSGIALWIHSDNGKHISCLHGSLREFDVETLEVTPTVSAIASRIDLFWYLFLFGSRLADLEGDFDALIISLRDRGNQSFVSLVSPFADLVYRLSCPWAVSRADAKDIKGLDVCDGPQSFSALLCRMVSSLLYDKIATMEVRFNQLTLLMDDSPNKVQGDSPPTLFFMGMVALALAAKHKATSKTYRSRAESMIRQLDGYVKQGCSNCHHYSVLLRALYLSCKSPSVELSKVLNSFDSAIVAAQNRDAVFVRAMACECAAKYLLSRGAKSTAVSYLKRSILLYQQWGAHGKAKHMKERYSASIER